MQETPRYDVPAGRHRVEQVINRSRFICTLDRTSTPAEAQAFLREVVAEFAGATHNCWAYVAGPAGSTNLVGMSDAGEPHGTAGRPMLTVLLYSEVGEITAVVTRYYGGAKLGTGGLVKAYSGIVQLALETLPIVERVDLVEALVTVGYTSITLIQQAIAELRAEIVSEEYAVGVQYRLRVPRGNVEALRLAVADATRGEGRVHVGESDDPQRGDTPGDPLSTLRPQR